MNMRLQDNKGLQVTQDLQYLTRTLTSDNIDTGLMLARSEHSGMHPIACGNCGCGPPGQRAAEAHPSAPYSVSDPQRQQEIPWCRSRDFLLLSCAGFCFSEYDGELQLG